MARVSKITDKDKRRMEQFDLKEWHKCDIAHYGAPVENYHYEYYAFKAVKNKKIVGSIYGVYELGVMFISDLIVAEAERGQGIAQQLINKALSYKDKYDLHKISLFTGIDWDSNQFYKKLGFTIVGTLKDYYGHHDFVIYEKYI